MAKLAAKMCVAALNWHYTMEPIKDIQAGDKLLNAVFAWLTWAERDRRVVAEGEA